MPNRSKGSKERSYVIGNVGAGARVQQGEQNTLLEGVGSPQGGGELENQLQTLLQSIANDKSLDEKNRAQSQEKIREVAKGLAEVNESPEHLWQALTDAKSWFGSSASWVGHALRRILKDVSAQKILETVSDAATKAAIESFLK